MEKEEVDVLVCENQLEFDFLNIENTEMEEEQSAILPEGFVIPKNHDWIEEEVLFVVIKAEHFNLTEQAYNLDLCGKKIIDWVLIAGSGCQQRVINDPKESLIEVLKGIDTDKRYIAVFYSDTPLLEKPTFYKIMDYFSKNTMNALALPRGYVFKTEFLKSIDTFASSCTDKFDNLSFTVVDNSKALSAVSKYLYDKIRDFHLRNGVIMYGQSSIFIEADVEIEAGAIIYPNNILKGQSYIGKGVVLEANNIISDSIISDEATIIACYIEKSKVNKGLIVGPFEKLYNSEL